MENTSSSPKNSQLVVLLIVRIFLTLITVCGMTLVFVAWYYFLFQISDPKDLYKMTPLSINIDSIGWTMIISSILLNINLFMYRNLYINKFKIKLYMLLGVWILTLTSVGFLIINNYLMWGYYDYGYMVDWKAPSVLYLLFFLRCVYNSSNDIWTWITFIIGLSIALMLITYSIIKISLAKEDFWIEKLQTKTKDVKKNNMIARKFLVVLAISFLICFIGFYVYLSITNNEHGDKIHNIIDVICLGSLFVWIIILASLFSMIYVKEKGKWKNTKKWLFFSMAILLVCLISVIFVLLHFDILITNLKIWVISFLGLCLLFCFMTSLFSNNVFELADNGKPKKTNWLSPFKRFVSRLSSSRKTKET